MNPSFAFLVLAYNHQAYIIEHLESIKYLVLRYGSGIDVDLIVNDDCSKDDTQALIEKWLAENSNLFRRTTKLFHKENIGTCASLGKMLEVMFADRCKLTAGDDVYSFENIFEVTKCGPDVAMISGRDLYLRGGALAIDRNASFLASATQVIYQNDEILHRFKHPSYNSTPNILYVTECLMHPEVRVTLTRYDVTEDWPLQVAIARAFPKRKFKLIDAVLVYYRRTQGSTYIVANRRFKSDKILIYNDLIEKERSCVEKIRLMLRRYCFEKGGRSLRALLNVDYYIFFFCSIFRIFEIRSLKNQASIDIEKHQSHYNNIRTASLRFRA